MVESARQREGLTAVTEEPRGIMGPNDEVVAFCPGCKAFETLWFAGDVLVPTRKFSQRGWGVFHDCGSRDPCRLLRGFLKQK